MLQFSDYDVFFFDCDGVILDSNRLKVHAMKKVLESYCFDQAAITECISYFSDNFGKSRFHHVDYFFDYIIEVEFEIKSDLKKNILADFSNQCRDLYLLAEITPGFTNFIEQCEGKRFVASGSEQQELREIFYKRGLSKYFDGIYGSPVDKGKILKKILSQNEKCRAIMFGDSESDMLAAQQNNIDFVFYSPYSNVKQKMVEKCKLHRYPIFDSFINLRL